MPTALLVVVLAGISESLGQSVVLFANRVKPARFVLSLLVNALLVGFGYGCIVVSTWATFAIPGSPHVAFGALASAVALSYTPLLLAFLSALPYAGTVVLLALRAWQLVVLVDGVTTAAHVSPSAGAAHVVLGWVAMAVAQHTFGKPVAAAGVRIANAAAGTTIVREQVAVRRVARQLAHAPTPAPTPVRAGAGASATPAERHGTRALGAIVTTFVLVAAIVLALSPLRPGIAGAGIVGLLLRVGLNAGWIVLVAIVVAAFLAPLETLGWWAGWYGDEAAIAPPPTAANPTAPAGTRRYVVYLDGISQSSSHYTPDIEIFLDALEPELPAGVRLVRGIMAYSVLNRPLDDDPMYARFWQLVERWRSGAKTAILGMFINIRNVMIVAVSADQRYGPLYNLGVAQVVNDTLAACGYPAHGGVPITLLGYSGGGQMCAEAAALLQRAHRAPVEVISLGGVMTGTCPFLRFEHLHHMYGSKDAIEPLGPLMFASRWRIFARSSWNRARRRGKITITHLGPVGHQVPGGMLDPAYVLPDGRTALRQTLDHINAVLRAS